MDARGPTRTAALLLLLLLLPNPNPPRPKLPPPPLSWAAAETGGLDIASESSSRVDRLTEAAWSPFHRAEKCSEVSLKVCELVSEGSPSRPWRFRPERGDAAVFVDAGAASARVPTT